MRPPLRALLLGLALFLEPISATADALIRSQAMFARTIAEYFVDPGRVRVELEIGLDDIAGFANLLPDDLHAKLNRGSAPLAERLTRFFAEDLVLSVDGAEPLPGRLIEVAVRSRMRRDEITGEPLEDAGADEAVLFVRLEYALPGRPASLTLHGLRATPPVSVGFVAYHGRIAVNDFRYLAAAQTLDLDWADRWYTQFRRRALRRQYFAPMSGFLYVEPYEVRKEIIVRPKDLQHWVDLGLDGRSTIPVGMQDELKRKVGAFLREHHPVEIDGRAIPADLARINFLERTLRSSRIVDPPEELGLDSALLGAIFVYPTDGLPERVTLAWDLWSPRIQQVPAASVDQAGPLPILLDPDWRVLEWRNFLKNPELPTLRVLAAPPGPLVRGVWTLRWGISLVMVALLVWSVRGRRRGAALAVRVSVAVVLAAVVWMSRDARLPHERTAEIVEALLHNVYRAFDFRGEEQIYDVLERSVSGDLLAQIFLETRRGLELESLGGARARVKGIELTALGAERAAGGAFLADVTWDVAGSVGHWGHIHQRRNRYQAKLRIAPRNGVWKLVEMQILDEVRL